MRKKNILVCLATASLLCGCGATVSLNVELLSSGVESMLLLGERIEDYARTIPPTRELVLSKRKDCLRGLTEAEASELTLFIQLENIRYEQWYFGDGFKAFEDQNAPLWAYVDQVGDELIVGYTLEEEYHYDKSSGYTFNEWCEKYGTPIVDDNYDNYEVFISNISNWQERIQSEELNYEFDLLKEDMIAAHETHDVSYLESMRQRLHDLDYYLLRYAPDDVAPYVWDTGFIESYYGTLGLYR